MKKNPKAGKFHGKKANRGKATGPARGKPIKHSRGKPTRSDSQPPRGKQFPKKSAGAGRPQKETQFAPKLTHSEQNKQ
jgi:hypothetical protein